MVNTFAEEYILLFYLFSFSFLIALLLLCINFCFHKVMRRKTIDTEKLSAYECGFDPFEEARLQFNIHYYVIAIIFLIFDIEVIYLLPGIFIYTTLPTYSTSAFFYFLIILTIGFIYEYYLEALKW